MEYMRQWTPWTCVTDRLVDFTAAAICFARHVCIPSSQQLLLLGLKLHEINCFDAVPWR